MTVVLQAPQWFCSDMVASENYIGAELIWKTNPYAKDIFISFTSHHRAKEITKVRSIWRVVEMIYWVTYGTCDYGVDIQGIARNSRSSHRLGPSLGCWGGDEDTSVVLLRQYFECQRIGSQTDKKRLMWNPQMWLWLLGSNVWGQYLSLCVCLHVNIFAFKTELSTLTFWIKCNKTNT